LKKRAVETFWLCDGMKGERRRAVVVRLGARRSAFPLFPRPALLCRLSNLHMADLLFVALLLLAGVLLGGGSVSVGEEREKRVSACGRAASRRRRRGCRA
jgi:hypothetical protein